MPTLNEQRNLFASVYQIHHLGKLFKKYFGPVAVSETAVGNKRLTQKETAALLEMMLRVRESPTKPACGQPGCKSVKTLVNGRSWTTRASGVCPVGLSDWRSAGTFPRPDTSTQTCRAAAIAR